MYKQKNSQERPVESKSNVLTGSGGTPNNLRGSSPSKGGRPVETVAA